jgi:hypothetical protein
MARTRHVLREHLLLLLLLPSRPRLLWLLLALLALNGELAQELVPFNHLDRVD